MNRVTCERESAVQRALDEGRWSDELREHAASCPCCSDLVLVAEFLRQQRDSVEVDAPLPDSSFIWWRAQLQARVAAADRATRIITLLQRFAICCGALLALLGAHQLWPQIKGWLSVLKPDSIPNPIAANMAHPGLVIAASLVVLAFLVVFDVFEPRTEE
jgi:hypothetical protein